MQFGEEAVHELGIEVHQQAFGDDQRGTRIVHQGRGQGLARKIAGDEVRRRLQRRRQRGDGLALGGLRRRVIDLDHFDPGAALAHAAA
jgi:hypothetical protein